MKMAESESVRGVFALGEVEITPESDKGKTAAPAVILFRLIPTSFMFGLKFTKNVSCIITVCSTIPEHGTRMYIYT